MSPAASASAGDPPAISRSELTGIVLAGGQGLRMGGVDKGLVALAGVPMVYHVVERLRPQVGSIVMSANRNHERYAQLGCRVVSDDEARYAGPLAGLLSALRCVTSNYVVTVPCDAPLLPRSLVERLTDALVRSHAALAVAHDGDRLQPTFMLVHKSLREDIDEFMKAGERSIQHWLQRHRPAVAHFTDCAEAFANVNDVNERERVEERMRSRAASC